MNNIEDVKFPLYLIEKETGYLFIHEADQFNLYESRLNSNNFIMCDAPTSKLHTFNLQTNSWEIDNEVLLQIKKNGIERIYHFAEEKRKLIAGTSDFIEISGWTNKLRIAKDILNSNATDSDKSAFELEIKSRNIQNETLITFSKKIIKKSEFFTKANGLIDGFRKNAIDLFNKCNTKEEIDNLLEELLIKANDLFNDLLNNKL